MFRNDYNVILVFNMYIQIYDEYSYVIDKSWEL